MAGTEAIQEHYDATVAKVWQRMMVPSQGAYPDYSGAYFNGDFSLSLREAQDRKHAMIISGLGLGSDLTGMRIFDVGCGWGAILNAVRDLGGQGVGITLSPWQAEYCTKYGLNASLLDYKDANPEFLGKFDAVASLGAKEHFCSVEEYLAVEQEEVYRKFFKFVSEILQPGGRLYLQTMTWAGNVPDVEAIRSGRRTGPKAEMLARIGRLFPESMLPIGIDQIVECASDQFNLIGQNSGRLDYVETLTRWGNSGPNLMRLGNLPLLISSAWDYITNEDTRVQAESLWKGDLKECFIDSTMEHRRIFFQKR